METLNQLIAWILENKTSISLGAIVGGRAFHTLVNGGGIIGMLKGILFGTNTPKIQTPATIQEIKNQLQSSVSLPETDTTVSK